MAELNQDVGLNIEGALADADKLAISAGDALEAALTTAVDSFSSSFSTAADAIQAQLAEALSTEQTVPFTADTAPAQTELAGLVSTVDATQTEIQVDADTSDAQAALDDLGTTADQAGASLSGAASKTSSLTDSAGLLAGGAALARGEVGGLGEAAGAVGGLSTVAVGGVAALGASVGFLFEKGLDATSMLQRFKTIVGESSDAVLHFKVGDLNVDLDKLAIKLGTDDEALRNASASLFQFAINSGASRQGAVLFTNQIDALAARAVALNPALGSVSDVAESMSARLARGGRFAASFGLSLTAAEINARALSNTNKQNVADLTLFEKSAAAAEISVGRYGSTLDKTVTEGSKNAIIQQRSLKEQLDNIFEAVGKPLVSPILNLFKESQPAVAALGDSVGKLAVAALPAVEGALQAAVPLLQLAATAIGTLTELTDNLGISATAAGAGIGFLVGGPVGALVGGIAGLASDLGLLGSAEKTVEQQTTALSKSIEKLSATDALARFNKQVDDVIQHSVDIGVPRERLDRLLVTLRQFKLLAQDDPGAAARVLAGLEPGSVKAAQFAVILNQVTTAQKASTAAQRDAQSVTEQLTASVEDQAKAYNDKSDAILASLDKQFASTHAAEAERDAIDNLNTAYDDAIKSGKSVTEAEEAQRRALVNAEEATARASAAVRAKSLDDNASLGPIDAARQATLDQIGSLEAERDTLAPDSPLRVFIQGLIDKLRDPALNTPHVTSVIVEGVDVTLAQLAEIRSEINSITSDPHSIYFVPPATSAGGGTFTGQAALAGSFVGEAGMEYVRGLPGGGFQVYPNSATRAVSSATPNVELNVDVRVDSRGIATTTITDTQGNTLAVKKQQVRADVRAL